MRLDVDVRLERRGFVLDAAFRCRGSALGVFGRSGSGKTTLLRTLAGLESPKRGRLVLDGEALLDTDRRVSVPAHRRGVGLVFQDARLFPHWSVEQNLRAGEGRGKGAAASPYGFDDVVALLEIGHLVGRSVLRLSGGERQRVALGRALLAHPRLLLLDEPLAGLDAGLKAEILPFLSMAHKALGIPTILVSHDLDEILQLTDLVLVLDGGRVAGFGPVAASRRAVAS
jgi:molybdate transport system ATP-binding protein